MNEIFKGLLDTIQQRISDAFSGLSDFLYLAEWYTLVAIVLAIAMVIAYFLPFKWVRAGLLFIVALGVAAAAGATHAAGHFQAQRAKDRQRIKELQEEKKEKNGGGGWFS